MYVKSPVRITFCPIDCQRHHGDYIMAKEYEADISDLRILSRLFKLALQELVEDAPDIMYIGSCSSLIAHMQSTLRLEQQLNETSASE